MAIKSILVVCNDGDYFLRHRRAVVERLAQDGFDVHVIAGGTPIPRESRAGWTYGFLPIERFAFKPWDDLRLVLAVGRLIASRKPATLHLITLKPAIFGGIAAVLARPFFGSPSKILITIPGLGRLMSPDGSVRAGVRVARFLVRQAIRLLSRKNAICFTFESRRDRELWLADGLIRSDNSLVIKGAGVNPSIFFPASQSVPLPPQGRIIILFASRLLKAKGLDVFIETARHFSGQSDLHFMVAGMVEPHDPDGCRLEDLQQEDAIEFVGEVSDVAGLLRQSHLVCLPTRYGEGIPRILIEAAACGLPCIASDIPGCREIVAHGVSGTLIGVGKPSMMAEAMIDAVNAYRAKQQLLAKEGREGLRIFLEQGFEESAVVEQFVSLLTPKRTHHRL
jgi:glycosyltransferase involved in cell wall biosynthesis